MIDPSGGDNLYIDDKQKNQIYREIRYMYLRCKKMYYRIRRSFGLSNARNL